ncbi:O-acetyl-ADP-ribose deacetylase MACROD2 isoform X1 [Silurus asotus]|uniref:O-acetyl-ADP-ribose deacetylase MACROD2 isoform X1 n=1 Tax=Silurus asotus TaxID=30991 RepID=A0AAD5A8I4_SILAS|nr:O-acetyl-ADP-ribose deacetylase MACROD2 isoform X1 [Silurus asotus]
MTVLAFERLLSLGQEERRKEYGDNYVALDNIFTWRHHHRGRSASVTYAFGGKTQTFERRKFEKENKAVKKEKPEDDEENTVSLCDKVSLYKGDITMLEVDAIVNAGCIVKNVWFSCYLL